MEPRFPADEIKAACRHADPDAIESLSASILGALKRRKDDVGGAPVRAKDHISDSEAANYTYRMVLACNLNGIAPPDELVVLLQVILEQDRLPQGADRKPNQRQHAIEYIAQHPDASVREVAKAIGTNASTVSRWGLLRK